MTVAASVALSISASISHTRPTHSIEELEQARVYISQLWQMFPDYRTEDGEFVRQSNVHTRGTDEARRVRRRSVHRLYVHEASGCHEWHECALIGCSLDFADSQGLERLRIERQSRAFSAAHVAYRMDLDAIIGVGIRFALSL